MRDCCLTVSDQKEEHISFWPDDNDVFFELDRYTQRKILVLFHRNESTEPVSEVGHIILAPRQLVFVLLLYMILHAKQTFFFISVLLLQIQLSRRQRVVIPFFSLLLIHFCTSPKPGTGFPSTYVVVFFFNHLKRDVIVCFVDISGCYFHHFQ